MKLLRWVGVVAAVFGLIGVRMVEDVLFYDPFLNYFRASDKSSLFPEFEWSSLILSHLFRFLLNLALSTLIVHLIFQKKKWTLQAVILMLMVFAITFPIYLYCVKTEFNIGHLFSFYMRRFVIQPIILLMIIPLFYYRQKLATEKQF